MSSAVRSKPRLWEQVKAEILRGSRGGNPGQWSARKAQLAVQVYKARGGGYVGRRRRDNALSKWTAEDWRTQSGLPSLETGERYLPRKAIEALSQAEYDETSRRKREGMARGEQFVSQPEAIARKTRKHRKATMKKKKKKKAGAISKVTRAVSSTLRKIRADRKREEALAKKKAAAKKKADKKRDLARAAKLHASESKRLEKLARAHKMKASSYAKKAKAKK